MDPFTAALAAEMARTAAKDQAARALAEIIRKMEQPK